MSPLFVAWPCNEMLFTRDRLASVLVEPRAECRLLLAIAHGSYRAGILVPPMAAPDPLLPVGIPKTRRSNCKKRTSAEPQS